MIVGIATLQSCGQSVPEKVKSAFAGKFPNASSVKWDKENDEEWEAEFKMDGKEYSANFTVDGNWKETEYEIKKSEIRCGRPSKRVYQGRIFLLCASVTT